MRNLPVFREVRNGGLPAVLDDFFADFDKLFRDMPGGAFRARSSSSLAMDIAESSEAFIVKVNVPGVTKEQLSLEVEGGKMTISIDQPEEPAQEGLKYHIRGRAPVSLKRGLELPSTISDVDAELKDGVLTVTLKKSEADKARRIEIK